MDESILLKEALEKKDVDLKSLRDYISRDFMGMGTKPEYAKYAWLVDRLEWQRDKSEGFSHQINPILAYKRYDELRRYAVNAKDRKDTPDKLLKLLDKYLSHKAGISFPPPEAYDYHIEDKIIDSFKEQDNKMGE